MPDPVIRVENLGKRYKLGLVHHDRLADAVTAGVHWAGRGLRRLFARNHRSTTVNDVQRSTSSAPFDDVPRSTASAAAPRSPTLNGLNGLNASNDSNASDELWALRNVSFEVHRGEVLGIIGRNAAGKSTLLKILTGITEPTEGRALIKGRVASLLEVGTGFHPELTGRENIFLNGAILGMSRAEIRGKFDEIVAFADNEKFIDTPVKRYSSGMHVRLAFAVAAHLEPEILLIDEVLAVGDTGFQSKCLGKIRQVSQCEGRTVLFVSHNLAAVEALCHRGILIENGRVAYDDQAVKAVNAYLRLIEGAANQNPAARTDRPGKGRGRLVGVEVSSSDDLPQGKLVLGRPARFVFGVDGGGAGTFLQFTIYDQRGKPVTTFDTMNHGPEDKSAQSIDHRFICDLDECLLSPGRYRINVRVHNGKGTEDHLESAAIFDVLQGVVRGRPISSDFGCGMTCMPHRWTMPSSARLE